MTSHINHKRELSDYQTDKENKKRKYSRSVDNLQLSSSEYDSSVSDSEFEMDVSELRDDLILDFVKKICDDASRENNETVAPPKPRRLMLHDDKKRKTNIDFNNDKNVKTNEKKVFKTSDKKNVKKPVKNTNNSYDYKPGPKSKTKDFNYDLRELIFYKFISYNLCSNIPCPPNMNVICYELSAFKCRVVITCDFRRNLENSPLKTYEIYMCRQHIRNKGKLIWKKVANIGTKGLAERRILDIERGFTYHFNICALDKYDQHLDLSASRQWI